MTVLTEENAKTAKVIRCIAHPEYGNKKFNYQSQHDGISSFGSGSNSAVLFEKEFHFWEVIV